MHEGVFLGYKHSRIKHGVLVGWAGVRNQRHAELDLMHIVHTVGRLLMACRTHISFCLGCGQVPHSKVPLVGFPISSLN